MWNSWWCFRRGKRATGELILFEYYEEQHLFNLQRDLAQGSYRHGPYRRFVVTDNKRREISVATLRDRVVHRLVYNYLVEIYDSTFSYDAWSCRKGKGVIGAIERAKEYAHKHPDSFVWRMDITKFFDSVQQTTLLSILARRLHQDIPASKLVREIIQSYRVPTLRERDDPGRWYPHW